MTLQAADTSVRTSIVVETPIERAFWVFTDDIGSWWNPEHHIIDAELAEMIFEPRVGGGEGWERMRDAVGCPEGWPEGLRDFAERVASATSSR
jgi:hypothetical protein